MAKRKERENNQMGATIFVISEEPHALSNYAVTELPKKFGISGPHQLIAGPELRNPMFLAGGILSVANPYVVVFAKGNMARAALDEAETLAREVLMPDKTGRNSWEILRDLLVEQAKHDPRIQLDE